MKILYDHQIFSWQEFGGISRYYYELLRAIGDTATLSLSLSDNEYLHADPAFACRIKSKSTYQRPRSVSRLFKSVRRRHNPDGLNRLGSIAALKRGSYDLFHPTYYEPYFVPFLKGRPFVLTVYDMIHEILSEHFDQTDPASANKLKLVQHASHIIAISESTKKDLVSVTGMDPDKISVIHLGSSFSNAAERPAMLSLPRRYILYVGTRRGYKNFALTARAVQELLKGCPGCHLVCAGGGPFTAEETCLFSELGINGRVEYYEATTPNLLSLYQRAAVFVFPSLYEGFGIPLLEAFSCGCPVIASRTAALMEVAGDAAIYFDPKNAYSLGDTASKVINDPALQAALREKGTRRLRSFSWEKCARETMAVYQQTLRMHESRSAAPARHG